MIQIGIIYALCTTDPDSSLNEEKKGSELLTLAITTILASLHETQPPPQILWKLSYQQSIHTHPPPLPPNSPPPTNPLANHIIQLSQVPPGPILEDEVLRDVRAAWERIVAEDGDGDVGRGSFMVFDDRTEEKDEEDQRGEAVDE